MLASSHLCLRDQIGRQNSPMDKYAASCIKCCLYECDTLGQMFKKIFIISIINFHDFVLIAIEQLVFKRCSQDRKDMRYV